MADLYRTLAEVAKKGINAQSFCEVGFGRIVQEKPVHMKIQSGEKELIVKEEEGLVFIARHLTDYQIPYEILSEVKATHPEKLPTAFTNITEIAGHYVIHDGKRYVEVEPGSNGGFDGTGTIKLLNHLMVDDKVIYMRMQGGSRFVIMDRLGEEEW